MNARPRIARERITGRRLQRIRREWFRLHPLCARCQAKSPPIVSLAVHLDHIVALGNGGPDFDVDDGKNRQGLCEPCHVEKTAEDFGYLSRTGSDAQGMPTDPEHPWNLSHG